MATSAAEGESLQTSALVVNTLPRIAIQFCVQCKWNLRAAYFAQELLQTFSISIGEVALIPVTAGIFTIKIHHKRPASALQAETVESVLWDRKTEGGFPETKELKNRVRNIIEPDRDLGHVDRSLKKSKQVDSEATSIDGSGAPQDEAST